MNQSSKKAPPIPSGYSAVDQAYLKIDFRNNTAFIDKKGEDITESVLTYQEAEWIIEDEQDTPLP